MINSYDKIYDKVNIALAFSSAILLLILNSFDISIFNGILIGKTDLELFSTYIFILCSCISIVFIIWATIDLLMLTRSKMITVMDSISIRNDEIYELPDDQAALWLIDKYTYAITELREINHSKQKKLDSTIIKIIISVLSYSLVLIIKKGV